VTCKLTATNAESAARLNHVNLVETTAEVREGHEPKRGKRMVGEPEMCGR
jgi:hypothetical protein